jgi:hypothetical protein
VKHATLVVLVKQEVQTLLKASGHMQGGVLAFPDVGWGKEKWLGTGLKWPQSGRGMWCVESIVVLDALRHMAVATDPQRAYLGAQSFTPEDLRRQQEMTNGN